MMRLLQMNYSCIPSTNDDDNCHAECGPLKGCSTPSNSVGMDVDLHRDDFATEEDYQKALAEIPEKVLAKKDELGLLMLERSATKGYHLVFKRKAELNQEDNLRWASDLLGVEFDKGVKDITRVFFTTTASEEDLLYLDDELFRPSPQPSPVKGEGVDTTESPISSDSKGNQTPSPSTGEGERSGGEGLYDSIPYTAIIEALENQLGGVPAHGSRNQFIFSMACHLRYVCNDDPMWIAEVLPTYGEGREKWLNTIKSACNRSQNKTFPKILRTAIEQARIATPLQLPQGGETDSYCCGMPGTVISDGECDSYNSSPRGGWEGVPPMPSKLPPLVKLLISKTPKIYQPAVAHAIFPALATHLWKTRFKYIDNVEHEATLMNVLMAGTGAGKNCIAEPIRFIMKDIVERDQINREKWDKTLEDFIRWSEQYDLWCKMKFFGEAIEDAETATSTQRRPGPQNLLALLPDEFTTDELQHVRRRQGVDKTPIDKLLNVWKNRNYVMAVEGKDGVWKKLRR